MRSSPVLLFDLGGVLIHTRGFDAIKELLAVSGYRGDLDDQMLRDRWLRSPAVRDFELGKTTPETFAREFIQEWGLSICPDAFVADLGGWINEPFPGTVELLDELRRDYGVCCLSNCNELHWNMMTPLLEHFDACFSSHLLGHIKPDPGAFEEVLRALEVEPEEVWFFDDSRANVEAAERVGMRAFLVRGPAEARTILQREGLL